MPRSLSFNNRWRFILIALAVLAPLCLTLWRTDAQQGQQRKSITPLRASETPEGSRLVITSDGALNDYSAYRSGERFYVLIPAADAPRALSGLRGRGFDDVRVQKRGNDVLLSFRLLAGSAARVSQKFNRLEILITVPSLVAANNAANANVRPQPTPQTTNTNTRITNTNTRTQTGTGNTNTAFNTNSAFPQANINSVNPNQIDPTQVNPQGVGTTRRNTGTATTNPSFTNPQTGIPDESATQSGTDFPPVAQTSPTPFPSITPPSDQLAQAQSTPGFPATTTTTGGPVTNTNAPAPASGTTLGAQLKQNWLFVALGLLIVGLIAWVLIARSRADNTFVDSRVEKLRETKTERIVAPAPAKVATPKATKAKAVTETPAAEIPQAVVTPVVAPVVAPPPPVEVEAEPVVAESSSAVVAPVEEPVEEVVAAPVAEVVEEAKGIEPVSVPVEVEQASDEVANLLAGHGYDENVVSTHDAGARQIITAELVAALAGRNPARHERAREAFIKHGYFDDATRTLRTAESPAERASAARSLGLVRDQSATPHLVAALEDSAPEVRRAAVESLAEVRDSAAVAPLESLRDREKDRRVPNALIQHAIEASVVGRAKAEPTAPVQAPYATTPLTEEPVQATTPLSLETDASIAEETPAQVVEAETHAPVEEPVAVEEAAVEEVAAEELTAPPVEAAAPEAVEEVAPVAEEVSVKEEVEEAAQPLPFSTEPVAETAEPAQPVAFEAEPVAETTLETEAVAAPPVIEEPVEVVQAEPSPVAETEVVAEEAAVVAEPETAPTEAEAVVPVPEETPAPVATAEPVIEYNDGTASEWVDVDMSATEAAAPPPVTPVAPVEEAALADALPETSATTEAPATLVAESTEAVTEELPETAFPPALPVIAPVVSERGVEPVNTSETGIDVASASKEIDVAEEDLSAVPSAVLRRLASEDAAERATAVADLGRIGGEDSFREISASFDDPSTEVRNAAARALFNLNPDRAASFTRALREAPPERRRHIGAALASSGLATEAIGHLMGESREKTYDAFSLLFLMSKAGEVQPLMRAVEEHPSNEVRLAVVKLLALSGQQEILPAFRRLAVRGSLPTEVRSAVMEAIYQISSHASDTASRS